MMKTTHDKLFFISYANLIAGLFVVLLIITASILLKNALAKGDLQGEFANLANERAKFEKNKDDFKQAQSVIYSLAEKFKGEQTPTLTSEDKEKLALLGALNEKEQKLKGLNAEFARLSSEFKALSAVKEGLAFELQAKFDANLSTNSKGALIAPSELFFESNSHLIRGENKPKLRGVLNAYFNAILQNKELMKGLEFIVVQVFVNDESHSTPQKMALAMKRAEELLGFIPSFYKDERLRSYLLVSPAFKGVDEGKSRVEFRPLFKNDFIIERVQELLR